MARASGRVDIGASADEIPSVRERSRTARVAQILTDIRDVLGGSRSALELESLYLSLHGLTEEVHCCYLRALASPPQASRLLTAEEAAEVLGVNSRWVTRNAHKLKATRRLGPHKLRFDLLQLQEDIAGGVHR